MVKMTLPLKNQILEKIKEKQGLTDKELNQLLVKESIIITEGEFNKILSVSYTHLTLPTTPYV